MRSEQIRATSAYWKVAQLLPRSDIVAAWNKVMNLDRFDLA
jgi:catalase (peroxidase I)